MKLSVDNQQRVTTAAIMVLEFYKVMMGTFLVIFVPQQCDNDVCSLSENFYNDDILNRVALIYNFATFSSILTFYGIEIKRENWCIKYLDIDPDKSNNHLDDEIEEYPIIKTEMASINKKYLYSLYIASAMLVSNFGVSSAAIAFNYAGSNTLTSIISFFLLVSMKLHLAYTVGTKSVHDERAFSAYMTISRTYNTIDADHRHDKNEKSADETALTHNDANEIAAGTTNVALDMIS